MKTNRQLRALQDDLAYHQIRVLLLIESVSTMSGHKRRVDGMTKLAKLDFCVRYPDLAPKVLDDLSEENPLLHLEANRPMPATVEAPMIRYKFGPWDDRYFPIVGALVGRELVRYVQGGRGKVALATTPGGSDLVRELAWFDTWHETSDRCQAVASASVGLSGSQLKRRIYERLITEMDRPLGELIF